MPVDPNFRMTIEDIFFIRGRGTIVTGKVSQGTLNAGDIALLNSNEVVKEIRVIDIEMFHRRTRSASVGDRIGVVLDGISKQEISRGDVLAGCELDDEELWWEVEVG